MAKFPIYESTASPPGTSGLGRLHYDTDTGGEAVGAAVQRLGASGFEFASDVYRMQGQAELTEAMAADQTTMDEMFLRWDTENSDETTYQQDFDETWSAEIASRELKNGWARREHALRTTALKPKFQNLVNAAVAQRVEKKWEASYTSAKAAAIQSGRLGHVQAMLANYPKMSDEEKRVEMEDLAHKAELEAFKKWAEQDPDAVLRDLEDQELERAVHLDADDYARVRNIAVYFRADVERRRELAEESLTRQLWGLSTQNGTTAQDIVSFIDRLPEDVVPLSEKHRLLMQATQRMEIINSSGVDPLRVRQDYGAYRDLLYKARDGLATPKEIREAVNAGKITIADDQYLNNVLSDQPGFRSEAAKLTDTLASMDRIVAERLAVDGVTGMTETAKLKIHRLLDDRLREARTKGKPMTDDELLKEALRIERQVEQEAMEEGMTPVKLMPVVPEEGKPGKPAYNGAGYLIGTYRSDGQIELTETGWQQLFSLALKNKWTESQTLDYARKSRFLVE